MDKNINFQEIGKYHEEVLKTFDIPEWIYKQQCPKCDKEIDLLSLRGIGLKLNAQHIGNFFIEICCQHCKYGYELHLRETCKNIKDLIDLLQIDNVSKKMEPDYLIAPSENNLTKKLIKEHYGNKKT